MVKWTGQAMASTDTTSRTPRLSLRLGATTLKFLFIFAGAQNHVWFVLLTFEESLCSTFESNVGANRKALIDRT